MGRPGRRFAAGAILLAVTGLGFAQPTGPADWAINLVDLPNLAPDIQSLPRLVATTLAMDRINGQLSQMDADLASWAKVCNSEPPRSYVERDVDVVFAGPGYLGILTMNASYCPGAAHGNHYVAPLTFDLVTGAKVDWTDIFPPALQDTARRPFLTDFIVGAQRLTDLYLVYAMNMDTECRRAIQDQNGGYFRVWPSAADFGLVLMPAGLPHAVQACADPVVLAGLILTREGFPEALVRALDEPGSVLTLE